MADKAPDENTGKMYVISRTLIAGELVGESCRIYRTLKIRGKEGQEIEG